MKQQKTIPLLLSTALMVTLGACWNNPPQQEMTEEFLEEMEDGAFVEGSYRVILYEERMTMEDDFWVADADLLKNITVTEEYLDSLEVGDEITLDNNYVFGISSKDTPRESTIITVGSIERGEDCVAIYEESEPRHPIIQYLYRNDAWYLSEMIYGFPYEVFDQSILLTIPEGGRYVDWMYPDSAKENLHESVMDYFTAGYEKFAVVVEVVIEEGNVSEIFQHYRP